MATIQFPNQYHILLVLIEKEKKEKIVSLKLPSSLKLSERFIQMFQIP